jgi:hypothetical protein
MLALSEVSTAEGMSFFTSAVDGISLLGALSKIEEAQSSGDIVMILVTYAGDGTLHGYLH